MIVKFAPPVLVSVTFWAGLVVFNPWLAKLSVVGLSETAAVSPVPVNWITCGLPGESSAIVRVPFRAPPAVGTNLTETLQAVAVTRVEQVLPVTWKSPVLATLPMVMVVVPVLNSVTPAGPSEPPTLAFVNYMTEGMLNDAPLPSATLATIGSMKLQISSSSGQGKKGWNVPFTGFNSAGVPPMLVRSAR